MMGLDKINYDSLSKVNTFDEFTNGIKKELDQTGGSLEIMLGWSLGVFGSGLGQRVNVKYFWKGGRFEDTIGGYDNDCEASREALQDIAGRLSSAFKEPYLFEHTPSSSTVKVSKRGI